jgi:hypothetical protein
MLAEEPYVPVSTPESGNTVVSKVPKSTFDALMCERADPFPEKFVISMINWFLHGLHPYPFAIESIPFYYVYIF